MQTLVRAKQHIFSPEQFAMSCHASTLVELKDGCTVAAWFAGTHEGHTDVNIWMSLCHEGIWTEPFCVADDDDYPCWNPVLHLNKNGVIYLYYKVGPSPEEWHTMLTLSRDNAATWSMPVKIENEGDFSRGPVKNKLIVTSSGRWLAPASYEKGETWQSYIDISDDSGRTWCSRALIPFDRGTFSGKGLIQPSLWESEGGNLHAVMRSTEGRAYRSDSRDGGDSWSAAYPIDIPNNNSGLDAVAIDSGLLALVYNPVSENWGARNPLSLAISEDNGETFTHTQIIDDCHPSSGIDNIEFSYPAVIASGNTIKMTYTWHRRSVEYVELEIRR